MKILVGLTLGFCLTATVPVSAAEVLYGADGAGGNASNLYILNPATGGTVSTVGPIGFAVTGLAIHPTTRVLYGSTGGTFYDPSLSPIVSRDQAVATRTVQGGSAFGSYPLDRYRRLELSAPVPGEIHL